jgi:hypothetical protein
MKKLFLILAFFSASAFAQSSESWAHITSTADYDYSGKKGSLEATKDGAKLLVKFEPKSKDEKIGFYVLSMKSSECKKGYGFVYYSDFNGKEVAKHPYVEDGGSVSAIIGDVVCRYLTKQPSV